MKNPPPVQFVPGNMATLLNIENPVWGLSVVGYGVIVEGIAAIRQRMDLAIRTTKGTDPLRPEFGSFVYKFVDAPVNVAVPNIKKEIIEALQLWVPEITVVSIRHTFEVHYNPIFEITYKLKDEDLIDKLLFDLKQGTTTVTDALNEIILQAFFPANPKNYRYQVRLIKNGSQVFPIPDPGGYATINDLFEWIKANWFFYGRWHLLTDKIVLYMKADGVTSATLAIEVLPVVKFEADFPILTPGQQYQVEFTANGIAAIPAIPLLSSPGQVLSFAQNNWSNYAEWFIEYMQNDAAIFTDEFSDEFAIGSTGYKLIGISHNEGFVPHLEILNV